jgi:hypothetical protein
MGEFGAGPYASRQSLCLAAGARPEDVRLVPLGYAEAALASYGTFRQLKAAGTIRSELLFQVSLPTPIALLSSFDLGIQSTVLPLLEAELFADVTEISAAIPHAELAFQWDVALEFAVLELGLPMPFTDVESNVIQQLTRLGERVPDDIELGYHFCYGDSGHKHFKEPVDMALLVKIANALATGSTRPIQWLHMPVPRSRNDDDYFAPLDDLRLAPDTLLYLGLVHATDGLEGTERRMAAATRHRERFGIATECGLGRRAPESIEPMLELLRAASNAERYDGARRPWDGGRVVRKPEGSA